uniref:Uncharacterized protein n=1 Tax=Anguilla anguilla TaxID=7936 RepID=A0A0E9R6Z8_ANGAN
MDCSLCLWEIVSVLCGNIGL